VVDNEYALDAVLRYISPRSDVWPANKHWRSVCRLHEEKCVVTFTLSVTLMGTYDGFEFCFEHRGDFLDERTGCVETVDPSLSANHRRGREGSSPQMHPRGESGYLDEVTVS
jgi:hypothetical protein